MPIKVNCTAAIMQSIKCCCSSSLAGVHCPAGPGPPTQAAGGPAVPPLLHWVSGDV